MRGVVASDEPADRPSYRIRRRSSARHDLCCRDEVVIASSGKIYWLSLPTNRDAERLRRLRPQRKFPMIKI